jgi:hypothetical protein
MKSRTKSGRFARQSRQVEGMARLPRVMGRGRALEVLLSSDDIGGADQRARRRKSTTRSVVACGCSSVIQCPQSGMITSSTLSATHRITAPITGSRTFGSTERHRSRTCLASGYDAVLVLKTSWGTGPSRSAADTN